MKRIVALSIISISLASCAPSVQVDPTYAASRTVSGSCANALASLNAAAVRTRPAVLFGANSWTPLRQTAAGPGGASYISTNGTAVVNYGVVTPIAGTVTVIANCTEANGAATVSLASSGQQKRFIDTLNESLLKAITPS